VRLSPLSIVVSSSLDSYQTAEQKAALIRNQRRAGAFAGFVLALLSTSSALTARWRAGEWAAEASLVLVFVALIVVLVGACFAVREIV
jgi:hypothetical protein